MKKIFLTVITIVVAKFVFAQQVQSSAFYETQWLFFNPSYSGIIENNMLGLNYRTQWNSIDGGPKTATVYGAFELPKQKIGLSGFAYNDKTGPTSRTGLSLSIAKSITFDDNSKLSFGIQSIFQQFLLDQTKLTEYLGSDPAIGNNNKSFKYDAGFGMSYSSKKLQLGVSALQLLQSKFNNYTGNLNRSQEARLYRHFYFNGNYKIRLDENIDMIPNFLVVYFPNAPTEYNLGTRFKYHDLGWLGLGMSFTGNANFSFGLKVAKAFDINYAFDFYNNPSNNFNVNAHELMLRYNLTK